MISGRADTAIIGAGSIGLAVAYYLSTHHGVGDIVLVDAGDPMALTSAQSGENYRNWWPHPVMTEFTDHSIDLMQDIARATANRIHMTRRGYALATRRADPAPLIDDLHRGAARHVRLHAPRAPAAYRPAAADWPSAPHGVDVLLDSALIRTHFPGFAPDITCVLHIRRAGDISAQQLGQFMLEQVRAAGGRVLRGRLFAIEAAAPFRLRLETPAGTAALDAARLVNAAGPFVGAVAGMLGETLPIETVFQQKIAFEDRHAVIPRGMPFAIDLDAQSLPWSDEERAILAADPATAALLAPMPGGAHCRPDGGDRGTWLKLGWATNRTPTDPAAGPLLDPHFPDILLRAACRLNPALGAYLGRLPRSMRQYGGFYTMTPENWPLIGPLRTPGAFVAGALSGFGTMAACATGALCAAWIADAPRPGFAPALSLARYDDPALLAELAVLGSTGVL
jgi:glycine/D-amino acid oxidase-like deaminating enzyme